jgi:hypothetical protein
MTKFSTWFCKVLGVSFFLSNRACAYCCVEITLLFLLENNLVSYSFRNEHTIDISGNNLIPFQELAQDHFISRMSTRNLQTLNSEVVLDSLDWQERLSLAIFLKVKGRNVCA